MSVIIYVPQTPPINTTRLFLSPLNKGVTNFIFENLSDRSVAKYLSQIPFPFTQTDANSYIERHLDKSQKNHQHAWIIYPNSNINTSIGKLSFTLNTKNEWHAGYWIAKEHQGNGYVTEALKAALDFLMQNKISPIIFEVYQGNDASIAVVKKLGAKYVRTTPTVNNTEGFTHQETWEICF